MCGYCVEQAAIVVMNEDENLETLKDERNDQGLFFPELVRVYRPGMPVKPEILERYALSQMNERELAIAGLVCILRDKTCRFVEHNKEIQLPLTDGNNRKYMINVRDPEHERVEKLQAWYEHVFRREMDMSWPRSDMDVLEISTEMAFALIVAAQAGMIHDNQWMNLMQQLSGNYKCLQGEGSEGSKNGIIGSDEVPTFDDMRLWIRREARRALWDAGEKEMAIWHDKHENFGPFLSWLLASRIPEAYPFFKNQAWHGHLTLVPEDEGLEPEWLKVLGEEWISKTFGSS